MGAGVAVGETLEVSNPDVFGEASAYVIPHIPVRGAEAGLSRQLGSEMPGNSPPPPSVPRIPRGLT